eukprot:1152541-Pelagomonas_calceolata.AAC.4
MRIRHVSDNRARSDQDSVGAAGVASSLIRNTGVKEVGRYNTVRDLLSDVQVMLGQTVCAAHIHMHKLLPIRAFAYDFQNHSAGNVVTLSYHVADDGALATWENVEGAIQMMTFWERTYKASGSFKAYCMLRYRLLTTSWSSQLGTLMEVTVNQRSWVMIGNM